MSNQTERTTPPATEAEHMAAICRAVRRFSDGHGTIYAGDLLREVLKCDREFSCWQEFNRAYSAPFEFHESSCAVFTLPPGECDCAKGGEA